MYETNILSFIIFLPAIVSFILMICVKKSEDIRNIAFITTIIILILVLKIYINFEPTSKMQFVTNIPWISQYGINYYIGVDGFSLTILMLIAILIPTSYLFLWEGRTKGYWLNMLLIQTGVTGTLLALDTILFYFFWEIMLLPVFMLIGIYGTGNKVLSTIKVTIYTMTGSLFMFVAIIYIGINFYNEFGYWSFQYTSLMKVTILSHTEEYFLFFVFVGAFMIKIPLFPFHTWITSTYSNAPTGAVFLLSSIMAKLGIYAIVRFMIPIFPDICIEFADYFVFIGIFGLIYFGIAALMQNDIKKMFAYSSASHLSLIAAGIFSLNHFGMNGALYLIIAHAISTGGLFLLIGMLEYETKFKNITDLGGIAKKAPIFTFIFAIMLFANIGLPSTNGFVSELLIIFGIYKSNHLMGFAATLTVLIAASYMLWMFQRAILQDKTNNNILKIRDLNLKEIVAITPWIILIFIMGIYPEPFINKFEPTVTHFIDDFLNYGRIK
jgi:NADH-quinone oxidoreductase subunit M